MLRAALTAFLVSLLAMAAHAQTLPLPAASAPASFAPVTAAASENARDVLARVRPAVIQIRGLFGSNTAQAFHGTGFAVAAGGLFATNYHVVAQQVQHPDKYRLEYRTADGATGATAWVNLLSIYALANFPPHGTYSASKAAAHSLAQCLRAEMRPAGIRVVNVFPGPIDDEWNQNLPPPKLAPAALASAIVKALQQGIEDVYPGDIAQEWLERWRENPKVLERELAVNGG